MSSLAKLTKYKDFLPLCGSGLRIITYVSSKGSSYQGYVGTEITNLKEDIFDSLYIQEVTIQMAYEKDGIYPILCIYASDDVKMIQFRIPDGIKSLFTKDTQEGPNGN